MSTGSKVILGICTFLPLMFGVLFVCYYISFISDIVFMAPDAGADPDSFLRLYFSKIFNVKVFLAIGLAFFTRIALIIYYILLALKTTKSEGEKVMWILLFIFLGTFSFIVYFFLRVVPMPPKSEIAGSV